MSELVGIANEPRQYAWGKPGGVSELLEWPTSDLHEAELWLGAHPLSPSRVLKPLAFVSLLEWEQLTERPLPFLLKILAAEQPLSLQVHPSTAQARAGYAREELQGTPLEASSRNYKDPQSKPELIIAAQDGFGALCGFREVDELVGDLETLQAAVADPAPFARWRDLILADGLEAAVEWLLAGGAAAQTVLAALREAVTRAHHDWPVIGSLLERYPTDPGVAVALMLNHIVLNEGEALWLGPGTIHAYLVGTGVELMGPSDNVLRGGLTPKHVDVPELLSVLDFTAGPPPRLHPVQEGPNVRAYIPASMPTGRDVEFWLREVTGDAEIRTSGPAILLLIGGEFEVGAGVAVENVRRGEALFCPDAAVITFRGAGRAFVAAT